MIDFNNDAQDRIADSLEPLIGALVRVNGCFELDGKTADYINGELVKVERESAYDTYVHIKRHYGEGTVRLHAFQEAHRILIDQ